MAAGADRFQAAVGQRHAHPAAVVAPGACQTSRHPCRAAHVGTVDSGARPAGACRGGPDRSAGGASAGQATAAGISTFFVHGVRAVGPASASARRRRCRTSGPLISHDPPAAAGSADRSGPINATGARADPARRRRCHSSGCQVRVQRGRGRRSVNSRHPFLDGRYRHRRSRIGARVSALSDRCIPLIEPFTIGHGCGCNHCHVPSWSRRTSTHQC
jgi:hypothetical protein